MSRPGRRGAYLLIKATLFPGHGLLYLTVPASANLAAALRFPLATAPLRVWALAWLAAAAVAAGSAFAPGPDADRWGFYALIAVATLWAVSYAAGAVLPGAAAGGFARGMISALLYAALAGVVLVVAGWPECSPAGAPPRRRRPGRHRRERDLTRWPRRWPTGRWRS